MSFNQRAFFCILERSNPTLLPLRLVGRQGYVAVSHGLNYMYFGDMPVCWPTHCKLKPSSLGRLKLRSDQTRIPYLDGLFRVLKSMQVSYFYLIRTHIQAFEYPGTTSRALEGSTPEHLQSHPKLVSQSPDASQSKTVRCRLDFKCNICTFGIRPSFEARWSRGPTWGSR